MPSLAAGMGMPALRSQIILRTSPTAAARTRYIVHRLAINDIGEPITKTHAVDLRGVETIEGQNCVISPVGDVRTEVAFLVQAAEAGPHQIRPVARPAAGRGIIPNLKDIGRS